MKRNQREISTQDLMCWEQTESSLDDEWFKLQEKCASIYFKKETRLAQGLKDSNYSFGPFESNRVKLSSEDLLEEEDPTFVNASIIKMDPGKQGGEYIIAASMPGNVINERDFWRMIYEQKSRLVVMLNNPYERNQRSDPYWPPQIGSEFVYGNLMRVRLLSEKKERSYVERKIEIQKKSGGLSPSLSPKTAQKQNSHSRDSRIFRSDADILSQSQDLVSPEPQQDDAIVVVHLQYTNWDDFTVPGDINEFTDFLNRTEMVYEKTRINQSPITVHCFGGQGRTGVFITSFLALRKLKQFGGKPQMVTELIQFLRNERKNLVETVEQFKYCFRVLLEQYTSRQRFHHKIASELLKHTISHRNSIF